ncbi:MAG: PAN domain-containing protein [Henriciella sp.]
MRVLPLLLAAAVMSSPAIAEKPTPDTIKIAVETDTYRFGDLYRSERGTTVEACAQMCQQDQVCAAWTLTPATFQIGPRCELKRTPGAASHRPGAVSGMNEYLQMTPDRHGEMRYLVPVPASRQPAAVPLDQLRPSPVPRVFGDPLPPTEPELLGAPEPKISAVMRPTTPIVEPAPTLAAAPASVPAPDQVETVEILRAPGQGDVPKYVKQPAPTEPHPLYKEPIRTAAPAAPTASASPATVFKDPARKMSAPQSAPASFNAVEKRPVREAPASPPPPVKVAAPSGQVPPKPPSPSAKPLRDPEQAVPPAPPAQPLPQRVPWTERDGMTPNYSVGSGYVPGDEEATAGFTDGVPEVGEAGS